MSLFYISFLNHSVLDYNDPAVSHFKDFRDKVDHAEREHQGWRVIGDFLIISSHDGPCGVYSFSKDRLNDLARMCETLVSKFDTEDRDQLASLVTNAATAIV